MSSPKLLSYTQRPSPRAPLGPKAIVKAKRNTENLTGRGNEKLDGEDETKTNENEKRRLNAQTEPYYRGVE